MTASISSERLKAENLKQLIPENIRSVMQAVAASGFECYLVGGAVRDFLLGRTPADYDLATNARPEETLKICAASGLSTPDTPGRNFGCVTICLDAKELEITTFRGERYSSEDAHRPAETWYCQTLKEDLARRDFTVNALALDLDGRLYDFFAGLKDLNNKILRTVGTPEIRYREDALRMLRACRFTAQLGFIYVQDKALAAPCGQSGSPYYLKHGFNFPVEHVRGLSLARVREELEKLLLAPYAGRGLMLMMATGLLGSSCSRKNSGVEEQIPLLPEALHLLGLKQNPKFHIYDTWEHTLLAVDNSPRNLAVRWALLLHDLGKGLPEIRIANKEGQPSDPGHEKRSAEMAAVILTRLGYSEEFVKLVVWLVAQHMRFAPMLVRGERTLTRWIRAEALSGTFKSEAAMAEAFSLLAEVFLADMGATWARDNTALMAEGRALGEQAVAIARTRMPVSTKDLAVKGGELLSLLPQNELKETLTYLLQRVQSGNLPNEKNALIAAVRKNIGRLKRAAPPQDS